MEYLVIEGDHRCARLLRFRASGRRIDFGGMEEISADDERELAAGIALRARQWQVERVILSLEPRHLFSRMIDIPLADLRKVREILPLELKGETACDTDELAFGALEGAGGRILALWTRRKELAARIALFAEAGLDPQVAAFSPTAWHLLAPAQGSVLVAGRNALAAFRDRRPLLLHPLADDAAGEIARTAAAVEMTTGAPLAGCVAIEGMEAPEPLPVPAEAAAAFDDAGEAAAAAGGYALVAADMSGEIVNFRHGELAFTGDRDAFRKKARLTLLLAAILLLLLFGDAGVRWMLVNRDVASLDASILSVYREIFPSRKKPVDPVAEIRAEMKRLAAAGSSSRILPALKRMAEAKGEEISGFYEAEVEGSQLRMKGEARSVQGVNDLKQKATTLFPGLEVGEMKTRADGSVQFTLRGTIGEEK